MSEKPSWLKVVGGTDHNPIKENLDKQTVINQDRQAQEINQIQLITLWARVTGERPANFNASTTPRLVQENARVVRTWTATQLHEYLSRADIWQRPSFTKAIFDEIDNRIRLNNFSAKE